MNKITSPLKLGMRGPDVEDLQAALQLMLDRSLILGSDPTARRELALGLERERLQGTFADFTTKLVATFQNEHGLPSDGAVDEPTAIAINKLLQELGLLDAPPGGGEPLPDFQHLVRGVVRYQDGLPIPDMKVMAFDKHLRREDLLGETSTNADGVFEIFYSVEEMRRTGQQSAALVVRVLGKKEGEAQESVLAESDIIFEAAAVEKVVLRVQGGVKHRWSEYEQLMSEVTPLLDGAPVSSLAEDEQRQEVSYLSGRLGVDLQVLAQLAGAHKLADETGMPAEVFFGLARKRLPFQLSALLSQTEVRRRTALASAVNDLVVPGRLLDDLDTVESRFKTLAAEQALHGLDASRAGPLGAVLDTTALASDQQRAFADRFINHKGTVQKLWQELRDTPELRDHVDEVQYALQLGTLTAGNVSLVERIQGMRANGIGSVRDLARMDRKDWLALVSEPDATGALHFPEAIGGKDDAEKAARYAGVLARMVEEAFPVEALAHRSQQDEKTPAATRTFFSNLLAKGAQMDLGRVPVAKFVEDHPVLLDGVADRAGLVRDLEGRQRLFRLAPTHERIAPLIDAGVTSAAAISRIGRWDFVARFGEAMGGQIEALKVHAQASHVTAGALNVMANLAPWFKAPTYVLPEAQPDVDGTPDWETLFGSFNLCGCQQCRSVHSPAAYLAELLAYLKERKLVLPQPGGGTRETNVRELLFARRPDLGDIELTCDNTNVALPYIDLVCEVLESAVSPFVAFSLPAATAADLDARALSQDIRDAFAAAQHPLADSAFIVVVEASKTWFVTDHHRLYAVHFDTAAGQPQVLPPGYQTFGSEAELEANPSHVNAGAYQQLREAVYGWALPLDLWAEESRVWLEKAGVERAELMRAFKPQQAPFDPGDLAIAGETLWLSKSELQIITATEAAPHDPWAFWGLAESGNTVEIADPADFSKTIVATLGWVDVLSHVELFLRQSSLDYEDLLRLLATRLINPDQALRIESADADDAATCDTRKLRISALDAAALQRMHRFLRLWRKLGWSMRELDLAIDVFQGANANPNDRLAPRLIEQLAVVRRLHRKFEVPLERLLALWGPIDTKRGLHGDPAGEDSLYDKLFLNATVNTPADAAFTLNAQRSDIAVGGALIDDHLSAVSGGLGVTPAELSALRSTEATGAALNLANLGALYRWSVLAQGMRLPVDEILRWKRLADADPFAAAHPEDAWTFIEAVESVSVAGFSVADVDFLLRHQQAAGESPAPEPESIAQVLTALRDGLQKMQDDVAIEADLTGDLTRKFLGLLKWDAAQIELVVATLNGLQQQSSDFLDSVRAFERPVFRAALAPTSMPDRGLIPRHLKARLFYDRKAAELCFSGLMLAADSRELTDMAGADATFKNAVQLLRTQSADFVPVGENAFLNEVDSNALLAPGTTVPDRFGTVLGKLVPRLRRLMGEAQVKQTLSDALGAEPAIAGQLMEPGSMDTFLAPDFVESHQSLAIDAARFPALFDAFVRLCKGILVAGRLPMSARQLDSYLQMLPTVPARDVPWTTAAPAAGGWLDIRSLPLVANADPVPVLFSALVRLCTLCRVREQLRPDGDIALDEVMNAARLPALAGDAAALTDEVAAILKRRAGWEESDTRALISVTGLALVLPDDLRDETGLARLVRCLAFRKQVNATAANARDWAREDPTENIRTQIKEALRGRHAEAEWNELASGAQDIIREKKRTALVAYLLGRPPALLLSDGSSKAAWHDTNGLFAYFLIDVEMGACFKTSRIKQAISSTQLFVQRCLLNLEPDVRIDAITDDAWRDWRWMKNYRVWEANRRIFLYPENWLESELRDDKTPFFKDFENELLQNELTDATAEDAFLRYLEKLDTVAKLELVGVYEQDAADGLQPVLHVFGRTPGTPAIYFYRRRTGSGRWTPWEKVDLDIEGDHLIPVIWNRRLYLFWAVFGIKAETRIPPKDTAGPPPTKYFEIQLAWSQLKQGQWLPKRITRLRVRSGAPVLDDRPDDDGRNAHVFFTSISADGLRIWPEWDNPQSSYPNLVEDEYGGILEIPQTASHARVDTYFFSGGRSDAVIERGRRIYGVFNPTGTHVKAMRFAESVPSLYLPIDSTTHREEIALRATPGSAAFELAYPHQDYYLSGRRPFFFEDQSRAFCVQPEAWFGPGRTWAGTDAIDPGKYGIVVEHYYDDKKKIFVKPAVAVADRVAAPPVGTTIEALLPATMHTQEDLRRIRREENILAVKPWLDMVVVKTPTEMLPVARRSKQYRFQPFYHPFVTEFVKELNRGGVDSLMTLSMQAQRSEPFSVYQPTGLVNPNHPIENVDFSPAGSYSQYNWELFFHAPLMIAVRLTQNQRFEEARRWFHYIFDPTNASAEDVPAKFWRTKPFHDLSRDDYLKQRIEQLIKPNASGEANAQLAQQIAEWRQNPFSPHAIARLRFSAYQKSVVMKYLDNLIGWGDQLFRRDTIEAINEATQLYVLAADILGPRPIEIAPRAEAQVQTYNSLDPLLANFSDRLVDIEYLIPVPSPDSVLVPRNAGALQIPKIPYFCVPRNDKLLGYWDAVADRLFKIRHCMNIEGVVRRLALFEPQIDPRLLVGAAAAGVDFGSVLNDLNAPLPCYRFQVMAQKASELCTEVKILGSALLAAMEKRDGETLALLRSSQEIELLKAVRDVREQQRKEAAENLGALENGKIVTEARRDYYRNIVRINPNEQLNLDKLGSAHRWQTRGQIAELVAAVMPLVGDFDIGASGWASSPVVKWKWGGLHVGMAAQATARAMHFLATLDQYEATTASTQGNFDRRWDEWKLQENLANLELKQIDRQIEGARIKLAISERELANHDLQLSSAKAQDEMMHAKFTRRELYDWMVAQVSTVFFQGYQLAYDVTKRAERSFRHELGLKDSNFIQFGYWDSLKKGLLAGERLFQDLKRMEMAYIDQNRREHEITKHVSLDLLHPQALASLRMSGSCFFELPEAIFDLDFPGHYLRRIKSVSLSIPCVTGPYTSVSARLTLLGNRIRRDPQTQGGYAWRGMEDPRFMHDVGGIQSISTSTGQQDSGMFELNFRDERYLPFEGAGVVSQWRLELPDTLRQFDYDTIADVVVTVRYTARDAGDTLKSAVTAKLLESLRVMQIEQGKAGLFRLLSLRHDFPDRWYHLVGSGPVNGEAPKLSIELHKGLFPAYAREKTIRIKRLVLLVKTPAHITYDADADPLSFSVKRPGSAATLSLDAQGLPGEVDAAAVISLDLGAGITVPDDPVNGLWSFTLTGIPAVLKKTVDTVDLIDPDTVEDVGVLLRYTIE